VTPRPDPYLLLAEATGFVGYRDPHGAESAALGICGEFVPGNGPFKGEGVALRAPKDSLFFTGTATPKALRRLVGDSRIARVQLAQALRPPRAERVIRKAPARLRPPSGHPRGPASKVLLGMVDSGCPFAHCELRKGGRTRVVSLWNQDLEAASGTCAAPTGFDYGVAFSGADLDAFIHAATSSDGSIDEELCYRLAGYEQVLHRQTHGSHSLGLMAGARRPRPNPDCVQVFAPLADHFDSSSADIAFVQLPQALLDCVSVAAMERHALDGFRQILDVAKNGDYEQVVISFGYESWVGPHDGTSWFERAVAEMCNPDRESQRRPKLKLVMAAGNSRNRRAHAAISADANGQATVQWHVPPGNEVPTFLEVWLPAGPDKVHMELTPPTGGSVITSGFGEAPQIWPSEKDAQMCLAACDEHALGSANRVVVVRASPTHNWDGAQGAVAHGIWTLHLKRLASNATNIHAYLGRVQGDPNSARRVYQPEFVRRWGQPDERDRQYTLNGHACGDKGKGAVVCGVFYPGDFPYAQIRDDLTNTIVARGQAAAYSGSGPTRGARQSPDVSLPMEDGIYRAGTLSFGTRSASVWRMSGTSTAAPAAARLYADGIDPTIPNAPIQSRGSKPLDCPPPMAAMPHKPDPALGQEVLNL